MTTAIVSGMVAAVPGHGGASWAILQYLLGLRRLGFDPVLVEPIDELDGRVDTCAQLLRDHGLGDRWCLVAPDGTTAGMQRRRLRDVADDAALLLNVSGMLTDRDVLDRVPVRVYLDLDPAFVQLWHHADGIDMRFDGHTHFVTVADAVGRTIPDCGRTWLPTLPPVVLEHWPVGDAVQHRALTTVANWRGYGSVIHGGVHYGQKVHAVRELLALPRRLPVPVRLALGIHPDEVDDLRALAVNGWGLLEPSTVAGTPDAYRAFVRGSWAELGIAKQGYVVSDSGWFSDRSACYLAAGRPVVAHDTGFGRRLPTGAGLFAFSTVDEAVAAVEEVAGDYERHRRAAREIAEAHLDSDLVLRSLLDRVLA